MSCVHVAFQPTPRLARRRLWRLRRRPSLTPRASRDRLTSSGRTGRELGQTGPGHLWPFGDDKNMCSRGQTHAAMSPEKRTESVSSSLSSVFLLVTLQMNNVSTTAQDTNKNKSNTTQYGFCLREEYWGLRDLVLHLRGMMQFHFLKHFASQYINFTSQ